MLRFAAPAAAGRCGAAVVPCLRGLHSRGTCGTLIDRVLGRLVFEN